MPRRAALAALLVSSLAAPVALAQSQGVAVADLRDAQGASAGTAEFHDGPRGVVIRVQAEGLTPGWHGAHLHMAGRCDSPGFQSAGGHTHGGRASVHGLLNARATDTGDLPNVNAGPRGRVDAELFTPFVSLRGGGGRTALLDRDGSAFLIHAAPDDHRTQPIGGSGDRVLCGVIRGARR